MGFRVNYKGLEVICDNIADLDLLAEKVMTSKPQPNPPVRNGHSVEKKAPNLFQSSEPQLENFVFNLSQKPLSVIKELVNAQKSLTDTELRDALNLESNMQLAGFMSSITKAAQKAGFGTEDILLKEMTSNIPGNRAYEYSISSDVIERLRGLLEMKN